MSNNLPSEELNIRLNHFLQNIYAPASKDGIPSSAGGEESDLLYNILFYVVVYSIILCHIVLYYMVLDCTTLNYIVLFYGILIFMI